MVAIQPREAKLPFDAKDPAIALPIDAHLTAAEQTARGVRPQVGRAADGADAAEYTEATGTDIAPFLARPAAAQMRADIPATPAIGRSDHRWWRLIDRARG